MHSVFKLDTTKHLHNSLYRINQKILKDLTVDILLVQHTQILTHIDYKIHHPFSLLSLSHEVATNHHMPFTIIISLSPYQQNIPNLSINLR